MPLVRGEVLNRNYIAVAGTEISVSTVLPDREMIDECSSATGWAALSNDTINIATATSHVLGTKSLEYDKVNGTDDKTYGGIKKNIATVDVSRFTSRDHLTAALYISDKTNVNYAWIALGSLGNYNMWRLADTGITNGVWTLFDVTLASSQVTVIGAGWDPSAITYVVLSVEFDLEAHALANIRWDHVMIRSAQMVAT